MKLFNMLVAEVIRHGEIIVQTPDLDLEELERVLHSQAMETIRGIAQVVYSEELTDQEKIETLKEEMELW